MKRQVYLQILSVVLSGEVMAVNPPTGHCSAPSLNAVLDSTITYFLHREDFNDIKLRRLMASLLLFLRFSPSPLKSLSRSVGVRSDIGIEFPSTRLVRDGRSYSRRAIARRCDSDILICFKSFDCMDEVLS